ncbi:MAG: response regulator transcription factor [Acaryochloridaceae cyanobacterium CSU_3_4]|nr:response regulator transcription factor [Acaryochloridaceae cyanobacterium CSU_3_4]
MKILIVEDNADLRLNINTALSRAGYVVDAADTYTTAEWLILQQEYDLLILDWMLPEGSGLELCQLYRQMGKRSPVIMLTARDRSADKVMGLDSGADDYVVKPVDIPELLARVRAMGRRSLSWQGECLRLGDLHLHLDRLVIAFGDHQTTLSAREAHLLEYFLRHPGQILSRDQIEQALWNWEVELGHNAVAVQVRRLRQRLQIIGVEGWIETVYGAGYRLIEPCYA